MGEWYTDILAPGILVGLAAIIGGWIIYIRTRKDAMMTAARNLEIQVEDRASEKRREERQLARDLAEENKRVAIEIKQETKSTIDITFNLLKQDTELLRTLVYAKIDVLDVKFQQHVINELQQINDIKEDQKRIQRQMEMMQTMAYGPDAKSEPAYLSGETETPEHKLEPGKGVFAEKRRDDEYKDAA